jgi:hypothetical protein
MHDICSSLIVSVCMCPHIREVKRVYDVYQYIFSGEEIMCWTCIIYSELSVEECHPA